MPKSFKEAVDEAMKEELHCGEIGRTFGETRFDQRFAFVTTKEVWYSVRLYMDEDHREDRILDYLEKTYHRTKTGADEHIAERRKQLESPTDTLYDYTKNSDGLAIIRNFRQLKPGDHILTECCRLSTHEGIFIGDGRVIQISRDENGKKETLGAKEESYACFETKHSRNIAVQVYRVRVRLPENIVKEAKQLVSQEYGKGEYKLFTNNCQHFASHCATGQSFSKINRHVLTSIALLPAVLLFGPIRIDETDN